MVLDISCIFPEPLYLILCSVWLPEPYDSHLRVCMPLAFLLCLTSGEPWRRIEEFEQKGIIVYSSLHRRVLLLLKRPVLENSPFFWNCKLLPYLYYLDLEAVIVVLMLTSNSSTIHYGSPYIKAKLLKLFFVIKLLGIQICFCHLSPIGPWLRQWENKIDNEKTKLINANSGRGKASCRKYILRWLSSKESACNARDRGSIPGLGRSPGEGNGYPFQYSCLKFHGQRSPAGRNSWCHKELDRTEGLTIITHINDNLIKGEKNEKRAINCHYNALWLEYPLHVLDSQTSFSV